jgi:hypothetical protein
MEEDKEWKKLKEKWLESKKKRTEKSSFLRLPKISAKTFVMAVPIILCLSLLFVFIYYNYLTISDYGGISTYDDINEAMVDILEPKEQVGRYSFSNLPENHCYWIRPSYNGTHHLVEIIDYESEDNCLGISTGKIVFVVDSSLNVVSDDCICDDSFDIRKSFGNYGMDLEIEA